MTRASAAVLVAVALAAGLALRLARLDVRPMHHDEANQAVKFGALVERGEYRYDTYDHHGPTLYYLTLPAAWLRGQTTLASLDERTLRIVPAVFGVATILLLPLMSRGIGRTAVAAAAVLMACSPAMVFYSRMYIQESMFACFTLAFTIAVGRALTEPGFGWPAAAGVAAGLAVATKETSIIVLPASLAAAAIAWWSAGPDRPRTWLAERRGQTAILAAVVVAAAIAALFYSSFLANPSGALGPLRAAGTYLDRGVDPADHVQPWHYYVGLLAWSSSGGLTWTEASCSRWPSPALWRLGRPASHASRASNQVSGRDISPPMRPSPWRSSRLSRTRRRGTCCRSTPRPSPPPGLVFRRSFMRLDPVSRVSH